MMDQVFSLIQKLRAKSVYFLVLIGIFVLIFPQLTDNQYILHISIRILIYMLLASSLNMIVGYTGQYNIGQAGFYAIGAYTAAIIATRAGYSFLLILPLCGIMAASMSAFLGFPTLRLRGIFFAFTTLGFSEVVRLTILNWRTLTRGTFGIPGIPLPEIVNFQISTNNHFYYLGLFLLVVMLFISHRLINSRIGRAWVAIREDENAAKAMGVETFKYKMINLMYGTFWAGIAGGFFAYFAGYISADSFILDESFAILAMVLVGGKGTLVGPIVGAIILTILPELVREIARYRLVIFGIAILVMVHYRPQGIAGAKAEGRRIDVEKEYEAGISENAVETTAPGN